MNRPSVSSALAWRTEELRGLADGWDQTARVIHELAAAASRAGQDTGQVWTGAAAELAQHDARTFTAEGDAVARALVLAAVAARDGADQLAKAQATLAAHVAKARAEGFVVGDDGAAVPDLPPSALLLALSGSDPGVAAHLLAARGAELSRRIGGALDELGAADDDAAHDVREALDTVDQVADTATGNTDGIPWEVRIAANRTNVAQAIVDAPDDADAGRRNAFYRGLLGEIDDPTGSGHRIDRQMLAFDPATRIAGRTER